MLRKFTLALLSLLLVPLTIMAQNVTISPETGNLIAGTAGGNTSDSGLDAGFKTMWKHKQLALSMATSDLGNLTFAGDLFDPSCATTIINKKLVIAAGRTQTFIVVTLPKGYRITGYTMVVQPDLYGSYFPSTASSWNNKNIATALYETPKWESESPFSSTTQGTFSANSTSFLTDGNQYLAVATAKDGDMVMNPSADKDKTFTITRTAKQDDTTKEWDMGNRLYFWVGMSGSYYSFSINSFEIYFTAEGTFDADVTPTGTGSGVNYTASPFATSKTDIGPVTTSSNVTSYNYANVKDIVGYNHIYQENAVSNGVPVAGVGSIYSVEVDGKGHYAFGNNTYFIEPPTTINTPTGQTGPIGYRIVGAKFTPRWGTETKGQTVTTGETYYVRRGTNGNNYLNNNLYFYSSGGIAWQVDEYGNLFVGSGEYKYYLACYGEGDTRMLSLSSNATGDQARWNLRRDNDGHLYYLSDGGNYYYLYTKSVTEGGTTHYRGFVIKADKDDPQYGYDVNNSYLLGTYTAVTTYKSSNGSTYTLPDYVPGTYNLNIYDKTGGTPQTVEISSEDDSDLDKVIPLTGFNNDAVKFSITGLPEGTQAMVDITLELESLNPYIDQLSVVCTEPESNLRLTQNFTASDFGVNGGAFHFILPSEVSEKDVNISFEDLYSHYGDETYGGTGNARYSFVSSPYFSAFDNVPKNKVDPTTTVTWNNDATDAGLYDNRYSPDIDKTHKIYAYVAGDKAFKFNNAEALTSNGNFTEYPFSVESYLKAESEGGTGGEFKEIVMNAGNPSQNSGTYYLVTADETRYNIAPTTAWQHRSYAFYDMTISLETSTYTPVVEFKKVYNETYFDDLDDSNKAKKDAFYGAVVTAPYQDGGKTLQGLASTDKIFAIINAAVTGSTAAAEVKDANNKVIGSYTGWDSGLKSAKRLLYIDFSQLAGIIQVTTEEQSSMQDYSNSNAANCLIFLPVGASAPNDNVAAKTVSGNFHAAHNIVLTDKQPFYSPYDIEIDGAQYAKYTRQVTVEKYSTSTKQGVILPFELSINSTGLHSSASGSSFYVAELDATTFGHDEEKDSETAHFTKLPAGSKTQANYPYMVDIQGGQNTFVVEEKGATIKATPTMDEDNAYMIYGNTMKVTYTDVEGVESEHYFTPRGFYSGKEFAESDGFRTSNIFFYYGSNNMFRSSAALSSNYKTLKGYPFRAFYGYTTDNPAKQLTSFMFTYDNEETSGIRENTKRFDFAVQSGKGYLQVTTGKDSNIRIYTLNGMKVAAELMQAGETSTFNVPAGVYIVNGMKIIVK